MFLRGLEFTSLLFLSDTQRLTQLLDYLFSLHLMFLSRFIEKPLTLIHDFKRFGIGYSFFTQIAIPLGLASR